QLNFVNGFGSKFLFIFSKQKINMQISPKSKVRRFSTHLISLLLEEKGDRLRWMRCFVVLDLHLISHFVTASPQGEA
ncbi:MAG: hypothetical protein IJZ59_01490, partial [Alphaproteobacteria bacterium]|nr:hypothetical protein [Alphaproteobacteria bacterium]